MADTRTQASMAQRCALERNRGGGADDDLTGDPCLCAAWSCQGAVLPCRNSTATTSLAVGAQPRRLSAVHRRAPRPGSEAQRHRFSDAGAAWRTPGHRRAWRVVALTRASAGLGRTRIWRGNRECVVVSRSCRVRDCDPLRLGLVGAWRVHGHIQRGGCWCANCRECSRRQLICVAHLWRVKRPVLPLPHRAVRNCPLGCRARHACVSSCVWREKVVAGRGTE